MPFGKYKDRLVCDLPISYIEWLVKQPDMLNGKLKMLIFTVFEIKSNGLEEIIYKLKKNQS